MTQTVRKRLGGLTLKTVLESAALVIAWDFISKGWWSMWLDGKFPPAPSLFGEAFVATGQTSQDAMLIDMRVIVGFVLFMLFGVKQQLAKRAEQKAADEEA